MQLRIEFGSYGVATITQNKDNNTYCDYSMCLVYSYVYHVGDCGHSVSKSPFIIQPGEKRVLQPML